MPGGGPVRCGHPAQYQTHSLLLSITRRVLEVLPFPILHLFSGGLVPAKLPRDHVHQLQISAGSALNRGPSPNNYLWCIIGLVSHFISSNLGWGDMRYRAYITNTTYLFFPWCLGDCQSPLPSWHKEGCRLADICPNIPIAHQELHCHLPKGSLPQDLHQVSFLYELHDNLSLIYLELNISMNEKIRMKV